MNPAIAILLGVGALGTGAVLWLRSDSSSPSSGGKPSKPSKDGGGAPSSAAWSKPRTLVSKTMLAPGWYADVLTNRDDGDCGHLKGSTDWNDHTCDDGGRWDPKPQPFSLRIVELGSPMVVSVDVRVVDELGIVERTRFDKVKNSDGRKRGSLDVNEFELVGSPRETGYCSTIVRSFSTTAAGKYLDRVETDCGMPATPRQEYSLYRATRDVTLSGDIGEIREYFAKIDDSQPAYADAAGLYALQLVARDGWVVLTGEIAASLSSQRVAIGGTFKTRAA